MINPIIGISGNQLLQTVSTFEGNSVAYTPQNFVEGLQEAGASPLILPVGNEENAKNYVHLIDGLLLTGGHDVDPARYHTEPHRNLQATFPQRDSFDLALIDAAIKKGIPILGVCRGMQILNVYFGGTLYQDLESEYGDNLIQHVQKTVFNFPIHKIQVEKNSYLSTILGEEAFVNSFHHQAVKVVGDGLHIVAKTSDGIIEALESSNPDMDILALQWHPETMLHDSKTGRIFFEDLVKRSKK
ncbi:gamma-glutamyl-gamma-aminobutyrate hydrolase family protein [Jeotgalibaca sp. MA1X17-3]|nr:gamma-glutamyl-gamma-aminobutyrate hydrolase family protein [Jeotgalibaca sp. MA1X17-3]